MSSQMDFFESEEIAALKAELTKTKEQLNNLRRGLFGRYDKMCNELTALQESIAEIKGEKPENKDEGKILEIPLRAS